MVSDGAATPRLLGRLDIATERGRLLDHKRVRLLEAIARHGSILRAAKEVPLTYKAAWDAVVAMNLSAGQPMVARAGNGSGLTDHGRHLVALYRTLDADTQSALDNLVARMAEATAHGAAQPGALPRATTLSGSAAPAPASGPAQAA